MNQQTTTRLSSFFDNATLQQKAAVAEEALLGWSPPEDAEFLFGVDVRTMRRWIEDAKKKERKSDGPASLGLPILRSYAKSKEMSLSEALRNEKLCDDADFAACLRVKLEQLIEGSAGEVEIRELAPIQSALSREAVKRRIAELTDFLRDYAGLEVSAKGDTASFTVLAIQ